MALRIVGVKTNYSTKVKVFFVLFFEKGGAHAPVAPPWLRPCTSPPCTGILRGFNLWIHLWNSLRYPDLGSPLDHWLIAETSGCRDLQKRPDKFVSFWKNGNVAMGYYGDKAGIFSYLKKTASHAKMFLMEHYHRWTCRNPPDIGRRSKDMMIIFEILLVKNLCNSDL